jgi:hypothetical protein
MALLCKIELSQTDGITVTVFNKDDNITQTMVFNGTSMVHTCQGESDTSTITQTCDSITIACKNYTVEAETIICKSTQNTEHKADGTFDVNSTGKATFKSSADMDISATTTLKMESLDFSSTATNSAEVKGLNTTINSDVKTTVSGTQLELTGTATTNLKGAIVKVASDATMDVEGLTTTVKGALVRVQGAVKFG